MAARGARIAAEYRYVRVLNGISTRLDPTSLALLESDREVAAVYPVRIAYPAQAAETLATTTAAVTGLEVPGLDGSHGRAARHGRRPHAPVPAWERADRHRPDQPGQRGGRAAASDDPGRPERHATELAGIITGAGRAGGLRVAPGASILPVRVAGWQPDAEGGYTVYPHGSDPRGARGRGRPERRRGHARRGAHRGRRSRRALRLRRPARPGGPRAMTLDMLVVVPAGNDGQAGPSYGSIAGPGGAQDALTVAASDARPAMPTVRVQVRAGLRVLFEGPLPLGGARRRR